MGQNNGKPFQIIFLLINQGFGQKIVVLRIFNGLLKFFRSHVRRRPLVMGPWLKIIIIIWQYRSIFFNHFIHSLTSAIREFMIHFDFQYERVSATFDYISTRTKNIHIFKNEKGVIISVNSRYRKSQIFRIDSRQNGSEI